MGVGKLLWTFFAKAINIHTRTRKGVLAIFLGLALARLCHFPIGLRIWSCGAHVAA